MRDLTMGRTRRLGARGLAVTAGVAASLLVLAGCSTTPEPAAPSGDAGTGGDGRQDVRSLLPQRIQDAGKVRLVVDTSFGPPWNFNPDDDPSKYDGIDPTLGRELFENVLGLEIEYTTLPFDGIIPALSAGRYDVTMNGMSNTAAREKQINQIHYVNDALTLVVADGNPLDIHALEDICGAKIAAVTGSHEAAVAQEQADKCADGTKVSLFPATSAVYLAIKSGRADVTVSGYAAAVYQSTNEVAGFDGLEALQDVRIGENPLGIGVPKSDPELAEAIVAGLNQMIEDGSYQKILDDWNVGGGALPEAVLNPQSAK